MRGKYYHKPHHILGLNVGQELRIVADCNHTNFVSRSRYCERRRKYIRDVGSREREQAVREVSYQNTLNASVYIRSLVIAVTNNKWNLSEDILSE